MELQQQISQSRNEAKVGQTFDAIITGVCDETEHLLEGRLVGQAPEIDGRLLVNDGIDLLPSALPAVQVIVSEDEVQILGGVVKTIDEVR